jgi:iron complex outermembrane receptor protein
MRNDRVWRNADVFGGGWNTRIGDDEGWVMEIDLSLSKIDRDDHVLETYSGFASNQNGIADSMQFQMRDGQGTLFTSQLNYADAPELRLTSPQGWGGDQVPGGQLGFYKGPSTADQLTQYKVIAKRDFDGFLSNIEGGVVYSRRNKWESELGPDGREGYFLMLPNGATSAPLPPSIGTGDLSFLGIPRQYAYDAKALFQSGYYDLKANENPSLMANNWDVKENIMTGYLQSGIRTSVAGLPLTGNIGAQLIQTDQESNGIAVNGSNITPVNASYDYLDFVPSMNMILEVAEGRVVRLSAARQMARQPMVDMRAGSTYGFDENRASSPDITQSPWSGSGGNPELEPWRSNSYDITYEHYFSKGMGYWALNGFYKDLVSYTYNQQILTDFTGYPTGAPDSIVPVLHEGYRSVPTNGDGGYIQGLEFTLSLPGERLADLLTGFGLIVSGSYVESSIKPNGDQGGADQPLPGLSDKVLNGTLYYEKAGFAARVSARYRSEYRGDIATFGPRGAQWRSLKAETVMDAQVSYTFQGGPLKDMAIILQGYNLTNEPLWSSESFDSRLVRDYQRYGAQYSVGVSWKY